MHGQGAWDRGRGDSRHAITTIKFWVAEVVVAPLAGVPTGAALGAMWGAIAGVSAVFALALVVTGIQLVAAPYRLLGELRKNAQAHYSSTVRASGGSLLLEVTNTGTPATFRAQGLSIRGLSVNRGWVAEWPVELPWASASGVISQDPRERRDRRLFTGESGTAWILSLLASEQKTSPHNLFQVYDLSHVVGEGYFYAGGLSDEQPAFVGEIRIVGDGVLPTTVRFFAMLPQRKLRALLLPSAPATPDERALVALAEHFGPDGENGLMGLFLNRKALLGWKAQKGFGISNSLFGALKLAGVLEDQQRKSYDAHGVPFVVDRYQLNERGRRFLMQMEATLPTPDTEGSPSE